MSEKPFEKMTRDELMGLLKDLPRKIRTGRRYLDYQIAVSFVLEYLDDQEISAELDRIFVKLRRRRTP